MELAKIVFVVLAILLIITTICMYFGIRKDRKIDNKISKKNIEKKVKLFELLVGITVGISVIALVLNIALPSIKNRREMKVKIEQYNTYIDNQNNTNNQDNNQNKHDDKNTKSNQKKRNYKLVAFPKKIESTKKIEFKEYEKDNGYFVYLKYKYNEKDFFKELKRIRPLNKEEINKDNYTIYVISNDKKGTYEIVLFDEKELQVTYVFNKLYSKKELNINEHYFLEK